MRKVLRYPSHGSSFDLPYRGVWVNGSGTSQTQTQGKLDKPNSALGEDLYSVESGFRGLLVLKGVGENKEALFIDPACDLQTLKTLWLRDTVIPFPKISQVLLTRHDRHNSQFALGWKENGARVLAAKPTGEILQPASVAKYWDDIVPLRTSRILHFMPAQGVDTDTAPTSFDWGGFKLDLQPLPCPAPDQHGVLIKDTKPKNHPVLCSIDDR